MLWAIWSLSAMETEIIANRPGRGGNKISLGRGEREENERERYMKEQKVNKMQSKKLGEIRQKCDVRKRERSPER